MLTQAKQRATRRKFPAAYGALDLKNAHPTVRALWYERDEDPEPCEPFGMLCNLNDDERDARQAEMRSAVAALFAYVSPRERRVVTFRYLCDMTLDQVAASMGITRERVRQIEVSAFRKMRWATPMCGVSSVDFFGGFERC